MLEKMVKDAGGSYLMCDTDSMAIVASEHGGTVSCNGGNTAQLMEVMPSKRFQGRKYAASWVSLGN
jgi:hypothetical protein